MEKKATNNSRWMQDLSLISAECVRVHDLCERYPEYRERFDSLFSEFVAHVAGIQGDNNINITTKIPTVVRDDRDAKPTTVRGIKGLATILQTSVSTAQKFKNSGKFDEALSVLGERTFLWDVEKVLEIARSL